MSTTPKTESPAWRFVKRYGPHVVIGDDEEYGLIYGPGQSGIINEDLHRAGLEAHVIADGRQIVAIDGKIVEVLCSDVIWVDTEDGRVTGRCGTPLRGEAYACPGHTSEREGWLAMSEADKAAWERRHYEDTGR